MSNRINNDVQKSIENSLKIIADIDEKKAIFDTHISLINNEMNSISDRIETLRKLFEVKDESKDID